MSKIQMDHRKEQQHRHRPFEDCKYSSEVQSMTAELKGSDYVALMVFFGARAHPNHLCFYIDCKRSPAVQNVRH